MCQSRYMMDPRRKSQIAYEVLKRLRRNIGTMSGDEKFRYILRDFINDEDGRSIGLTPQELDQFVMELDQEVFYPTKQTPKHKVPYPNCPDCGENMVRNVSGFECLKCGETLACS